MGRPAIEFLRLLADAPQDDASRLAVHLGHHFDEVSDWAASDIMMDGLDREQCRDLIRARTLVLIGCDTLAMCVAEMIFVVAPLAVHLSEIDVAIHQVAEWLTKVSDEPYERIVMVKGLALETGLLSIDPDTIPPHEIGRYHAAIELYNRDTVLDRVRLDFGGHGVHIVIEHDCTLVLCETEPDGGDWVALYAYSHHEDDGDDGWDDEPEPEPEPEPDPSRPELLDA